MEVARCGDGHGGKLAARAAGWRQTAPVDHYVTWFDLAPGADDLALVDALENWLGWLRDDGRLESWELWRRKLGLAPDGLGEFLLDIRTTDLGQLEAAFQVAASRAGEAEERHSAVYRQVRNARFGLYRDFPDRVRLAGGRAGPGGQSGLTGARTSKPRPAAAGIWRRSKVQ